MSAASRRRRRPPHLPAPRRQSSSPSCVVPKPPASRSSTYVSGNEDTEAEQYERQDLVACRPRGTGGPPAGSTTAHERDDELVRRRHPPRGRAPPRPGSSPPPPTCSWSSRLPRWPLCAATSPVPSSGSRRAAPTRCSAGLAPLRGPPQGRRSTVICRIYACARRELCVPATGGHPTRQERLPTTSPEGQRAGGHQEWSPGATDAPLLRWHRRLQRAALNRWKLRELQQEEDRDRLAWATLPTRVVHAVLCFISALLVLAHSRGGRGGKALRRSRSAAFAWLAMPSYPPMASCPCSCSGSSHKYSSSAPVRPSPTSASSTAASVSLDDGELWNDGARESPCAS